MARSGGRIAILCGPGGNGGDGFVAARLLAERGYRVERLSCWARARRLRGDPAHGGPRCGGVAAAAERSILRRADLVIDALYGAGLSRDSTGWLAIASSGSTISHARGGRCSRVDSLGSRRRNGRRARRRGAGQRQRHFLSPEARPSPASGPRTLRAARARRHRHRRGGAGGDRAADLSQCARRYGAADFPKLRPTRTNIPAARRWSLSGGGASHGGGAAGGARGAAGRRGPGRRSPARPMRSRSMPRIRPR